MSISKELSLIWLELVYYLGGIWGWRVVSMKEISRLAGVSVGTVSFVLNGKGEQMRISVETRQKVFDAARQLGYSPNISARRLRSSESKGRPVIALLWTLDARASLISRFLSGIQHRMALPSHDFELLIQPYEASRIEQVKSLQTGTRFNGAIIANPTEADLAFLESREPQIPIVLYHRNSSKYSCVSVDSFQAGKRVAEIFKARGHQDVALVVPDVSSRAIEARKLGFIEGARERKLHLADDMIVSGGFSEEGGYTAVKTMLSGRTRPTAAFFLSDQMAIGALAGFHERGIQVPAEMEVIGYDNVQAAQYTIPPLSTIHLPVEEMAFCCTELLLDMIRHHHTEPKSVTFETRYVSRGSCGEG